MSLYRAYRPQRFAEIVGQDHVKRTISNAVASGTVSHAYLFSGPRGIGKTSIARILAMAVNCAQRSQLLASSSQLSGESKSPKSSKLKAESSFEPCGDCTTCQEIRRGSNLNVVEIDAASNRGIDEIRALKEGIAFAPAGSGKKIYIIDEVHMLTKEAFNALLKTLEEPPAHAIFVLATTELHRLPETIISRTQHFAFKRATIAEIISHLGRIAGQEKLTIDDEAIGLIAIHADGGFRDALSLLDQLAALGEERITAESVRLILGIAPEAELLGLMAGVDAGDAAAVHAAVERFATHGYDPAALTDALVGLIRQALWQTAGIPATGSEAAQAFARELASNTSLSELAAVIERLVASKEQLRWSPLPYLPLELALLAQAELPNHKPQVPNKSQTPISKAETVTGEVVIGGSETTTQSNAGSFDSAQDDSTGQIATSPASPRDDQSPITNHQSPITPTPKVTSTEDLPALWKKVIEAVRTKNASLGALLRSAQLLELTDEIGRIEVPFSFYADRIKDRKSVTLIAAAFATVVGGERTVECVVAGTAQSSAVSRQASGGAASEPVRSSDQVARDILDVFGSVETGVTSG